MNAQITEKLLISMKEMAALLIWELGAIQVRPEEPFKLVSGNYSPIYINCRKVISNPTFMGLFTAFARLLCGRQMIQFDLVAGGETAGIPFAAYLANSLSCPLIYVRKTTKPHGLSSQVEGLLPSGARVLLVEDLITDAKSKLTFIEAIKSQGGVIKDVLVLFDRQQGGQETLMAHDIKLNVVTDLGTVLRLAAGTFLTDQQMTSIHHYLEDPEAWHRQLNLSYKEDS